MRNKLSGFFEKYLRKEPLFVNKAALQANYTPRDIPHRDEQIEQIAKILAPSLRLEKPSNLFIYGMTGTGKSLTIKSIISQMRYIVKKKDIPLKFFYLNCKLKKVADTEYRVIAHITRGLGEEVPATGLPTDEVYKLFVDCVDREKKLLILILDEIDQLVNRAGDEILYNLTRLNPELKNSELSIIGISNDLVFIDHIDPRVKSSLSEEEIVFPPYNAVQLQDILRQRAEISFKKGVIKNGVIEKCAAYAAREHGDARRALELLRVAGELAERSGSNKVMIKHIDEAEEKIERDRILDVVSKQPKQSQIVLYSICVLNKDVFTGDVYSVYKNICLKVGLKPLTQRRVSDIIAELDMLGIINARVVSKGRYGRTKEISLAISDSILSRVRSILEEVFGL